MLDVIRSALCTGSLDTVAEGLGTEVKVGVEVDSVELGSVPSPRAKTAVRGLRISVPNVTPNVLLSVEKSKKSALRVGFETAVKDEMLDCPRSMGRS